MVPRTAAIVVGLAAGLLAAGAATATAPPAPPPATTPVVDTSFLRAQAEAELIARHPEATQVACAVPPADEPGVRFFCYGALPGGAVLAVEATMNDDGGLEFTDLAGAAAAGSPTTVGPSAAYEGTGDAVVQATPISGLTILAVGHDGTGDVTIQPQSAGAAAGPPLTSSASAPVSRFLVGLTGPISAFAVTAAGAWSITVEPSTAATPLDAATPAAGAAPDVLRYAEPGEATVTFEGAGPLTVVAFTAAGRAALVEAAGPYSGSVTLPAGPGFVTIDAVGAWTVSLGDAPPPASATG